MVLVHAATQKHHFHVQLPKSTTMPGAPQLPSAVLLLFLMCSLDHDVAAFRGKWWRPQEAISQGLAPNRRQICWKFAWFCQGKLCLSRAWLMLEPWPEAPMGVSILPCGFPCFLPGSWTPEAYYIASSIVLMNYSHFSVRCSYPFASRSWSTALKPWRWVVVRRGRWLSLNLPVWLGCSVIMPVRHWRCPDPRKMTRFNHEAECTTCSW